MPQGPYDRKAWNRTDIKRYLSGQMPDAERHALERAALDDHFLADAIEGLSQRTSSERDTELETLSQKLRERTDDKVRRIGGSSKWWWAAAASLLLLVGGTWYWQSGQDGSQPKITQVIPNDTSMRKTDTSFPSTQLDEHEKERSMPTNAERPTNGNTQPTTINPKPTIQNDQLITHNTESITVPESAIAKTNDAPPPPSVKLPERSVASAPQVYNYQTERAAMHYFKGRVLDENGQGIPFANIQMAGGGAPTYADAKGEFKVVSMDSSISIISHAAGYVDARSDLNARQAIALVLMHPSNSALSEVVVTGMNKRSAKKQPSKAKAAKKEDNAFVARSDDDEEEESEPVDGWAKYEHYLNNNNRLGSPDPQDASPEVEIIFLVSPNGTPYDMKVERSSSPKYEAEALRLLREGPKWQASKDAKKPIKGYLTLQF